LPRRQFFLRHFPRAVFFSGARHFFASPFSFTIFWVCYFFALLFFLG
jgi:hypothetical protein